MSEDSDDDDYMSDRILSDCLSKEKERPGLVRVPAAKRELEQFKKREESKAKKPKSAKVLEEEARNAGLDSAISEDNKGFALLKKMGYVPGEGLGKTEKGISEPIKISVKTDRFGLGRETVAREIREYLVSKSLKKLKDEKCSLADYRRRLAEKAEEVNVRHDLYKSQKVCENLDTAKDIKEPMEIWFWPPKPKEKSESDDEESEEEIEDLEPGEKLTFLTTYLRTCHLYCIWCGTNFEDAEDMETDCPGAKRILH